MKKFLFQCLLALVLVFGACTTISPDVKHTVEDVCYFGDLNPFDLMDDAKYEIVKVNGEAQLVPGPTFVIAGFRAVGNQKIREALAIITPHALVAIAYKVNGIWYCFHFDPETECFIYEGKADDKAIKGLDSIYKTIFQKEAC